jgi:uncharacterized protein YkwD
MHLFTSVPQNVGAIWVDGILLCVLLFYVIEGFMSGAIYALFDLIKFVLSFLGGLLFYGLFGRVLILLFHMPTGYANALGFFVIAFVVEVLLHFLLRKSIFKVNTLISSQEPYLRRMNNFLGILPGGLSGGVLVMFIVTVVTAMPVTPFLKNAITTSRLGGFFIGRSQVLEKSVAGVFGGAAQETLNFLTVEPQSNASVALGFTTTQGSVDTAAEEKMLQDVNTERTSRGITSVEMDTSLQQLARNYAQEMLSKGYFSHYTPDGLSPFDRMNNAHISFTYAGENLAFSANEDLAMQGLMNSQGHRENILSKNYHKIGIGVIDAGIYGEMFVQEFTD